MTYFLIMIRNSFPYFFFQRKLEVGMKTLPKTLFVGEYVQKSKVDFQRLGGSAHQISVVFFVVRKFCLRF